MYWMSFLQRGPGPGPTVVFLSPPELESELLPPPLEWGAPVQRELTSAGLSTRMLDGT